MTKPETKRIGRPRSTMTPEVEADILRHVELGMWPDRAALMCGVKTGTFRAHKKRNAAFATALERAEAKAEARLHSRMLRWSDRQWTATAWLLERRWPERYGKRDPETVVNVNASAKAEATAKAEAGPPVPSNEQLKEAAAKLAKFTEEDAARAQQIVAQRN